MISARLRCAGRPSAARSGRIHLVRQSDGIEREFAMKDFADPTKKPNVDLQNGDIIYVPGSFLSKVGYLLQKLSPAISYALFGKAMVN